MCAGVRYTRNDAMIMRKEMIGPALVLCDRIVGELMCLTPAQK